VQLNPLGLSTLPYNYSLAKDLLAIFRSIPARVIFVHGATALHYRPATSEDIVIPTRFLIVTSRFRNCEFVQLPSPGAPLNPVH
jgi:hypothetical protein